jgi:hypothetical protein
MKKTIHSEKSSLGKSISAGSEIPFPFFGAGFAAYYEWAEIQIRFQNIPGDSQIQKIIKSAPEPIQPNENDFCGRMLIAGSEQFVHLYIEAAYGDGKSKKKSRKSYNYVEDEEFCTASDSALEAFEADIERWLIEVHQICPIECAVRHEDNEAGGTVLSVWHEQSLKTIPSLMQKWADEKISLSVGESAVFKYMFAGILEYGGIDYENVSGNIIDAYFPEEKTKRLLQKNDLSDAQEYITRQKHRSEIIESVKEYLDKILKEENFSRAADVVRILPDKKEVESVFVDVAGFHYNRSDNIKMLNVSLEGNKFFPENDDFIAKILFGADKTGQPQLAEKYMKIKSSDPLVIANQSYALVISGRLEDAHEILINHFDKGGVFNVQSLNNLLYVCSNFKMPDALTMEKIISLSIEKLQHENYFLTPYFVNNLLQVLGNTRPEKAQQVYDLYKKKGGIFQCAIYTNYAFAALKTKDKPSMKKVLKELMQMYDENPSIVTGDKANAHLALWNIACLGAMTGNKEKMLMFLKITKKYHPDFVQLKSDEDFKEYWNDSDFLKLFE